MSSLEEKIRTLVDCTFNFTRSHFVGTSCNPFSHVFVILLDFISRF
jgi:hypothetical protein